MKYVSHCLIFLILPLSYVYGAETEPIFLATRHETLSTRHDSPLDLMTEKLQYYSFVVDAALGSFVTFETPPADLLCTSAANGPLPLIRVTQIQVLVHASYDPRIYRLWPGVGSDWVCNAKIIENSLFQDDIHCLALGGRFGKGKDYTISRLDASSDTSTCLIHKSDLEEWSGTATGYIRK